GEEPRVRTPLGHRESPPLPRPTLTIPLKASDATVGMLKVWVPQGALSQESETLMAFAAGQLALAAERWQLRQQLRETTRALEEADHFGTGVFDGLTDALVTIDPLGTVTFANRAAEDLVGRPRRSLIGHPLGKAIPTAEDLLLRVASDSLIAGRPIPPREVVVLRPDGGSLPAEARGFSLRNEDGRTTGVALLLKDLREQKALQQERHHLDRLAVIGEMSAVVAHEFRNPLAGIKLGVQYLLRHVPPENPLRPSVAMIAEEAEQMARTVEDILLISRRFELHLRPCDPVELVEHTLSHLAPALEGARIQVRREFASPIPLVMADAARMDQVFTNLVQNAIDAMPEGGELTVTVAFEGDPKGSRTPGTGDSVSPGQVVFKFRDTGPGIPLVALTEIFEPFYTTKTKGTGLGLAIVDRIVKEHGGQVRAANAPDRGAEFTITLPAFYRESSPWQPPSS
ncbi:MAG: two-component system sensor histidine kinase NtrB, partial [Anaerolineae bacterium]